MVMREIPDELIDQLLGDHQGLEQLTGPDGLINQLRKRLIERAAGAELAEHLSYEAGEPRPPDPPLQLGTGHPNGSTDSAASSTTTNALSPEPNCE